LSKEVQTKSTDFTLPKSNNQTFGVGYVKLNTLSTTRKDSTAVRTERAQSKKFGNFSISGQAFGVGAFEEEDEDIYAQDNMANYDIDMTISKARRALTSQEQIDQEDGSLLALGYNDAVLFAPAKDRSKRRFERFQNSFPRPDIPRNWRPNIVQPVTKYDVVQMKKVQSLI